MATGPFCAKIGLISGLTFSPSFAMASDVPTAEIEHFLEGARAVVTELGLEAPNAESIVSTITGILADAKPVATAYGQKHAQCAEQLARLIELFPDIDTWSAQQIRRDIEAGAALPQAEGCYPARDIVAHPSIVRALARLGIQPSQRARLTREMNEAIEHMAEISEELGQE